MSEFPSDFNYENSRQNLDIETQLHPEFKKLMTYVDDQRQQAESDCRWYFLINLSKVDENMKKCLFKKIMERYPGVYYRESELINQGWTQEMYKYHSFDPKFQHIELYPFAKLKTINDCTRKYYFLISLDSTIDGTKYGWPTNFKMPQ